MLLEDTDEKLTFEGHSISIYVPVEKIVESRECLVFADSTSKRSLQLLAEQQFFLNLKIKVKARN